MQTKINLFVYFILVVILVSCAGRKPEAFSESNQYYYQGKRAFENNKWIKAIDNLKLFLLNNPGSQVADSAQFLLAESYFNNEEYLMAISEYRQLTNKYSYSPLVEKGRYKIAKSYVELSPNYHLDQKNTRRAIRFCQSFISNYPNSEYVDEIEKDIQRMRNKLAHKIYTNGVLYRKMQRWESAEIYFNELLAQYYDTEWTLDAKLEKAYCLIRMRKFNDYKQVIASLEDNYPNHKEVQNELLELEKDYKNEKDKIAEELKKREGRF